MHARFRSSRRKRAITALATLLTAGLTLPDASAQTVDVPGLIGAWTAPFEEGTAAEAQRAVEDAGKNTPSPAAKRN